MLNQIAARRLARAEAERLRKLDARAWAAEQIKLADEYAAAVSAARAGKSGALEGWVCDPNSKVMRRVSS